MSKRRQEKSKKRDHPVIPPPPPLPNPDHFALLNARIQQLERMAAHSQHGPPSHHPVPWHVEHRPNYAVNYPPFLMQPYNHPPQLMYSPHSAVYGGPSQYGTPSAPYTHAPMYGPPPPPPIPPAGVHPPPHQFVHPPMVQTHAIPVSSTTHDRSESTRRVDNPQKSEAAVESHSEEESEFSSSDEEKKVADNSPAKDKQKTPNDNRYPNTDHQKTCPVDSPEITTYHQNSWAWRNEGLPIKDGIQTRVRKCLGVLECSGCQKLDRPKTQTDARNKKQLGVPCEDCQAKWVHLECTVRSYEWVTTINGVLTSIWHHKGVHNHPRPPPGGSLSPDEDEEFVELVRQNPNATAHQLRTGSLNSKAAYKISEVLAKPGSARYQKKKAIQRLGIRTNTSMKGGFAALKALGDLRDVHGEPFLVEQSLTGMRYLMFQTTFMRQALAEVVEDWVSENPKSEGRHGLVTDGNHSYFNNSVENGVLLVTAVFLAKITSWLPVLLTWIARQDIQHHRPHFKRLYDFIYVKTGDRFDRKYLLQVMDYSAAQRKAHALEFAAVVIRSFGEAFSALSAAAQAAERKTLEENADVVGCNVHFQSSVIRIRDTAALVPPESVAQFRDLVNVLVGIDTTEPQFQAAVSRIEEEYPRIKTWIGWWTQSWVAKMAFPAKRLISPERRQQVPSTSNPVEHQHSLLNHAVGYGHDLVDGAENLLLHMEEMEAKYNLASQTRWKPPEPNNAPRKKKTYEPGDGRGPDTVKRIQEAESSDKPVHGNLRSYQNLQNSCYFDGVLELWFRSWINKWDSAEERAPFSSALRPNSFLSLLTTHYNRRDQASSEEGPQADAELSQELIRGQAMVRRFICEEWKLAPAGEFHNAAAWLQPAIQIEEHPVEVQAYFGVQHQVVRKCSQGHLSFALEHPLPSVITTVDIKATIVLRAIYAEGPITLEQYWRHYVPRGRVVRRFIHEHSPPSNCTHEGCPEVAKISGIQTIYPKILHCSTAHHGPDAHWIYPDAMQWPASITIPDPFDGEAVEYKREGELHHIGGNHYIAHFELDGVEYDYDDLVGRRKRLPGYSPLLLHDPAKWEGEKEAIRVYTRVSKKTTIERNILELTADGDRYHDAERRVNATIAIEYNGEVVPQVQRPTGETSPPPTRGKRGSKKKGLALVKTETGERPARGRPSRTKPNSDEVKTKKRAGRPPKKQKEPKKESVEPPKRRPGRPRKNASPPPKEERVIESEDEDEDDPKPREPLQKGDDSRVKKSPAPSTAADDSFPVTLEYNMHDIPALPQPDGVGEPLSLVPCGAPRCADIPDGEALVKAQEKQEVMECRLCWTNWHTTCVADSLLPLREEADPDDSDDETNFCEGWACPLCIHGPKREWDKFMLRQFILVDTDKYLAQQRHERRIYPAQIRARVGNEVQLVWYRGNLYPTPAQRPQVPYFTLSPNECFRAKWLVRLAQSGLPNEMGSIEVPYVLYPDAVESDDIQYRNTPLISALQQATGTIYDILQGRKEHRIWPLFEHFFLLQKPGSSSRRVLTAANHFALCFKFPLFPADESTIHPFMYFFETAARNTEGFLNIHHQIICTLASILLRTVAVRVHLGLRPSHDPLIFLLAYSGVVPVQLTPPFSDLERIAKDSELSRVPALAEQAYSASISGIKDTRRLYTTSTLGLLHRRPRRHLNEEVTYATSPIQCLQPGQPFVLPSGEKDIPVDTSLLPPLPRQFRDLQLQVTPGKDHPRPKPRRVGTTPKAPPPPIITLSDSPVSRIIQLAADISHETEQGCGDKDENHSKTDSSRAQNQKGQTGKGTKETKPPAASRSRGLRSTSRAQAQKAEEGARKAEKRKADNVLNEGKERGLKVAKKKDSKFWTWGVFDAKGKRVG